jgi:hypothetical protein
MFSDVHMYAIMSVTYMMSCIDLCTVCMYLSCIGLCMTINQSQLENEKEKLEREVSQGRVLARKRLKGPKHEIRRRVFFTQSKPVLIFLA